jgi:hypothetical protein
MLVEEQLVQQFMQVRGTVRLGSRLAAGFGALERFVRQPAHAMSSTAAVAKGVFHSTRAAVGVAA